MNAAFILLLAPAIQQPGDFGAPDAVRALEVMQDLGVVSRTWQQRDEAGQWVDWYQLSLDDGATFSRPRATSYLLTLRDRAFDPQRQTAPAVSEGLRALPESELWIVQYVAKGVEPWREEIRAFGARDVRFLANHANIWRMSPETAAAVGALPFVRWVGPFHTDYKLSRGLRAELASGAAEAGKFKLVLAEKSAASKTEFVNGLAAAGGSLVAPLNPGRTVVVQLAAEQIVAVAQLPEVMRIERFGPPVVYMDKIRNVMGANYVETVGGYTGTGVRAEAMDTGLDTVHSDWGLAPLIHSGNDTWVDHGTCVYGINFSTGGAHPSTRGVMPDAQGVFASFLSLDVLGGSISRYDHTMELTAAPWECVYQTNSWGFGLGLTYDASTFEIDEIAFDTDLLILQAQGNQGTSESAVEAWAKNVLSVGAVQHQDTETLADDTWGGAASTGPAEDDRIKPDMCAFYENIFTSDGEPDGYVPGQEWFTSFGGTSGATPTTAGHAGLMHEMWHDGIFGNLTGTSVFDSRPHAATAKALMIHTAKPYDFAGAAHDLNRLHQGWGLPDLQRMYDDRADMFIIDEQVLIKDLEVKSTLLTVAPGEAEFRATLVYADPPGTTSSSLHRVNDLTLRVISPTGVVYHGNEGLRIGNASEEDPVATNTLDTVENVWVQNPVAGNWRVEVIADEINQDGAVETPQVDSFYALVVSPVDTSCNTLDTVTLTGPGVAPVGQTVSLDYFHAPPNVFFQMLYSKRKNGGTWQGVCMDIGPNIKVAGSGVTAQFGDGTWVSPVVPQRVRGRTIHIEMYANDGVQGTESNAVSIDFF